MIASPTAASAAATVITMKTNSWAPTSPKNPENATRVRFTALSISSMQMKIVIVLRFTMTPAAPMVKRAADSNRYHDNGTIDASQLITLASGQDDGPHDRHQDQH